MKIGMNLHMEGGYDAAVEEARRADEQGYDSVWLSDHILPIYGNANEPDRPLDLFLVMTAIAAVTQNVRLAWGTLNTTLRPPLLFAKMLTTLDVISHGRVICTMGSGWNLEEWRLYNLPLVEDHDERAEYCRELIALYEQMWTHPAPEETYFDGKYVKVDGLPFNPEPIQKPYPPIWMGGESDATLTTVKTLCDGWMPLGSGSNPARLKEVTSAPDWPTDRPMSIVKGGRIIVRATHDDAMRAAQAEYEHLKATAPRGLPETFEEFAQRETVGSTDEVLERIDEFASWGITDLRINFVTAESQEALARLVLPRLDEVKQPAASR
jgi:alkanesulfonate monooxygenase SsuD/methylene tetrahydromethanopterin reductase-like flavin-dependent oxidoreductase (luciferase family)